MSLPISACHLAKALNDDKEALASLQTKVEINLKHGGWTFVPCPHKPRCQPDYGVMEKVLEKNTWLLEFLARL